MRISDWSSDVCSSDLEAAHGEQQDRRLDGEKDRDDPCAKVDEEQGPHRIGAEPGTRDDDAAEDERAGNDRPEQPPFLDLHQRQAISVHQRHEDAAEKIVEGRSEEHTSELQSLMRISYAVFCLKKKKYT